MGAGTAAVAFDPDREAPAQEVEGAHRGGVVRVVADIYGVDSMDPTAACCSENVSILTGLVTRTLTQYVYDPDRDGLVLIPDIATDLGTPNDDYTQWTYTIREGVRFEDGTEVTADDVAYGIKRSFDREAFAPGWGDFSKEYFLDGDAYDGPYRSGSDYEGVTVKGNTLTLKMSRPFPDLPYYGAYSLMGPVPQSGTHPDRYGLHPMATGPYKVADFKPDEALTLVRNEQWDANTDPGRHQYPNRYVFTFTQELQPVVAAMAGDTRRARTTLTYFLSPSDYREVMHAGASDRLVQGIGSCTSFLFPNYRLITDIRVRQAIGYAFPYRDFWRSRGEIPGVTSLPATSMMPPGVAGRIDEPPLPGEPWQTDPQKAEALLAASGFERGDYRLSFPYTSDPDGLQTRDVLVQAFEQAGFRVDPYRIKGAAFLAVYNDPDAPLNLRLVGWCQAWPSGSSWIPELFSSDSPENRSFFSEKAVDAEIERIVRLPLDEQPAVWGALEHQIQTKYYPAIVTGYGSAAHLHGSKIGGMNFDIINTMPTWKDLYVIR